MLREIEGLRQDDSGLHRRWFHDDYFDLFVWQGSDGTLNAFELCYGANASECAVVWRAGDGFYHDGPPPVTEASDMGDPLRERFAAAAVQLPAALRQALDARLGEYAATRHELVARRRRYRRADWQQTRESR